MMRRLTVLAMFAVLALPAAAQRPVFEPDDFLDPAIRARPVFLSRIVIGGVSKHANRYRPAGSDAGFVLLTNSLYYGQFQFDYKRSEPLGEDEGTAVRRCDCPEPVYFPTPPPGNATPAAPEPGPRDTLQVSFYRMAGGQSPAPVTLRYRFTIERQPLHTVVRSATTEQVLERRSGHDQSFTLDADTHLRIRGRDVWGTLYVAHTSQSGTPYERVQNEIAYVSRLPGFAAGEILFRPKLTVGMISGRGATGLNLVNPYLEAFWRHGRSKVNFHLVWSPQATRSGEGWQTNHEVALFADRTLCLIVFGRRDASTGRTFPWCG
jgi:hypothetical protein